jgi:cysteine synthase
MQGVKELAQAGPGLKHVTTVFERHRRSAFVVGFIGGLIVSLSSVTTVFYLADRREKKRRRKRLRQYGLDASQNSAFEAEAEIRARKKGAIEVRRGEVVRGVEGLIGNTPLMRINSLSDLTGCEILVSAVHMTYALGMTHRP